MLKLRSCYVARVFLSHLFIIPFFFDFKQVLRSDYLTMNLREYDLRRIGREEGITIGEQRGIETTKLDNARNMLADNVAVEMIARYTGLPLETVRKLKAELSAAPLLRGDAP